MQGEWGRWTRKRPNCDTNGSFVFQITVWLPFYRYIFPCVYQYLSSTCCLVVAVSKPNNLMIKASCKQDAVCTMFKRLLVDITSLKHIQMYLKLWIAVKDRTCCFGKESYEQLKTCETAKKLCSAFWMRYSLGMWQLQQPFFLSWTYADRCNPEGNAFFLTEFRTLFCVSLQDCFPLFDYNVNCYVSVLPAFLATVLRHG